MQSKENQMSGKKPFWEAEREYRNKPFAPFWEKERLLRDMMPRTAERIAKKDVFLPSFSKNKFKRDN